MVHLLSGSCCAAGKAQEFLVGVTVQEYLTVEGGRRIAGEVRVSGAKNAALPLLICSLLTAEECCFENVPALDDIAVTLRLLEGLGATAQWSGGRVQLRVEKIGSVETSHALVKALRASFWVLGPLLARAGRARVALPGGDAIGSRPVDLHLRGLVQLGAEIQVRHGVVVGAAPRGLCGAKIDLAFPSVGATHQLLLAAALARGETVINGAARECEVVALAEMLQSMGCSVEGAGSSIIRIVGRESLGGAQTTILGDRIEAATYLLASAMTGGSVTVSGLDGSSIQSTLELLVEAGCAVTAAAQQIQLSSSGRLKPFTFETAPFPGVATDVQPLLMAAACCADGISRITENVFESRFGHTEEYRKIGAKIAIAGRTAVVTGTDELKAGIVFGADIRAAAGLVLLALVAEGRSVINEIFHLDRGYDGLVDKLSRLGAVVHRNQYFEQCDSVVGC